MQTHLKKQVTQFLDTRNNCTLRARILTLENRKLEMQKTDLIRLILKKKS